MWLQFTPPSPAPTLVAVLLSVELVLLLVDASLSDANGISSETGRTADWRGARKAWCEQSEQGSTTSTIAGRAHHLGSTNLGTDEGGGGHHHGGEKREDFYRSGCRCRVGCKEERATAVTTSTWRRTNTGRACGEVRGGDENDSTELA